jgi:hypothetical protein
MCDTMSYDGSMPKLQRHLRWESLGQTIIIIIIIIMVR